MQGSIQNNLDPEDPQYAQLANDMSVSIGDTLLLSSPVDISLITKKIPKKIVVISGIFNLEIFDFDSRYIISSSAN